MTSYFLLSRTVEKTRNSDWQFSYLVEACGCSRNPSGMGMDDVVTGDRYLNHPNVRLSNCYLQICLISSYDKQQFLLRHLLNASHSKKVSLSIILRKPWCEKQVIWGFVSCDDGSVETMGWICVMIFGWWVQQAAGIDIGWRGNSRARCHLVVVGESLMTWQLGIPWTHR